MQKTIVGQLQYPSIKNDNNNIHVALLYGGMSAEREVSLMSYQAQADALLGAGYKITLVDMGCDIALHLDNLKPDVVFNGLYGTYAEDGCLPGLLEIMGIKYTHSGVMASAVGFDKKIANSIFNAHGVKTAPALYVNRDQDLKSDPMKRPDVIKPISQGSSIGVIVVFKEDDFNFADYKWEYGNEILVEEYIPGKEIFVAVLNGKAIGCIEAQTTHKFHDYDSKYKPGINNYVFPDLSKEESEYMLKSSEKICNLLGCRGAVRLDFRFNTELKEKGFFLLEINTHPGMTPHSSFPKICAKAGIEFAELLDLLIKDALHSGSVVKTYT